MRTKFDIKIKWNQIIRDEIEEKSNIQKDKKQKKNIVIKIIRAKLYT
jgi:hypothetical protein